MQARFLVGRNTVIESCLHSLRNPCGFPQCSLQSPDMSSLNERDHLVEVDMAENEQICIVFLDAVQQTLQRMGRKKAISIREIHVFSVAMRDAEILRGLWSGFSVWKARVTMSVLIPNAGSVANCHPSNRRLPERFPYGCLPAAGWKRHISQGCVPCCTRE